MCWIRGFGNFGRNTDSACHVRAESGSLATMRYFAIAGLAVGKPRLLALASMAAASLVGNRFELLSENPMGERIVASPVPAADRLFLRGDAHLFCVGGR